VPRTWLLLPVVTGLLLFASFPKVNQPYLAWFALIPLLLYVHRVKPPIAAFNAGVVAGLVQWTGLLIWIPPVLTDHGGMSMPIAILLFLLLALLLAAFHGISCLITRYLMNSGGDAYILTFPVIWVAVEYLRNFIPFGGFPWLLIGYSQTDVLWLVQVADIAGVHGVSLIILMVNTAVIWLILKGFAERSALLMSIITVGLFAATAVYGSFKLKNWESREPTRTAALLQGNLSFDDPHSVLAQKLRYGYRSLAQELETVDLIVLPEAPAALDYLADREYGLAIKNLARLTSLGLILNDVSYEDLEGTTRIFNSALFLDPEGLLLAKYDKIQLVPFGEYVPWRNLFFFAESITKDVSDFHPGSEYSLVSWGEHPGNAVICFEAIFSALCRRFVLRGSQLIVNLTNDRWYGDSAAPYQHLAMARWRAIENRRYLLRATNSGISAIVDPAGRVRNKTAATGKNAITAARGERTFLSRAWVLQGEVKAQGGSDA